MSPITTVAVVGASGNIGAPTVQLLHAAGFQITALTRPDSSSTFPDYVTVKTADYTSIPSLVEAFTGIDAVISCISYLALDSQPNLVEAAAQAGVTRFLPAEYGADCLNPKTREFPILASKIQVEELLMAKAKAHEGEGMSYTLLFTGLFLDWGLETGMIVNVKEGKARLYDGGDRIVSFTTTRTIAKAIVGCLEHLEETRNRGVYVQDIATSQNHIVGLARGVQPEKEWMLERADTEVMEREAEEAWRRKDYANMVGSVSYLFYSRGVLISIPLITRLRWLRKLTLTRSSECTLVARSMECRSRSWIMICLVSRKWGIGSSRH
jgi:uncharacterized protein YbjT (DUF2867 family)